MQFLRSQSLLRELKTITEYGNKEKTYELKALNRKNLLEVIRKIRLQ